MLGMSQTPIHRSQYLRGGGSGVIGAGDGSNEDFEKMKKARLRNDLLNQMNDNMGRRLDERRKKNWEDEYDDARIWHDNMEQQKRYDHEEWKRKKYLVKDGHLPGPGGWDPYSRYGRHRGRYGALPPSSRRSGKRDGNDDYGWWYGGPKASRSSKYRRGRYYQDWNEPPPLPWMENNNQVHVNSGGKKPPESDTDPVAFYKGDMKSWWDKFVPANVASKISTMVNDQLLSMQKKLDNQELSIQKEITKLKTDANNSDNERLKVLNQLRNCKKKLTDQQLQEDLRHNYIYHILFNNWKMREKMMDKDLDALPSRQLFPQLKNNYATLGEKINWGELAYDSKKLVSHIDPVSNEYLKFPSVDDIAKQDIEVNFFDVERINAANHNRLEDLKGMKHSVSEPQLDSLDKKLYDFLDKESTFKKINLRGDLPGDDVNDIDPMVLKDIKF